MKKIIQKISPIYYYVNKAKLKMLNDLDKEIEQDAIRNSIKKQDHYLQQHKVELMR